MAIIRIERIEQGDQIGSALKDIKTVPGTSFLIPEGCNTVDTPLGLIGLELRTNGTLRKGIVYMERLKRYGYKDRRVSVILDAQPKGWTRLDYATLLTVELDNSNNS